VATLHKYTEGWAVGLRLAALALRGHTNPIAFLADLAANSHRYIVDYLRDEALEQQSQAVQRFLICTSFLRRFCPALCAAVLEIDIGVAQQQLHDVEHANLFLVSLSSSSQWYRYHHQFQSMLLSKLRERLDPPAIVALYRRAVAWLEEQGETEEAIHCLTEIGDFDAAADLVENRRIVLLNEQRYQELSAWLGHLPAHVFDQRPKLLVTLARLQLWRQEPHYAATLARLEVWRRTQAATLDEQTRAVVEFEMVALQSDRERLVVSEVSLAQILESWSRALPYFAHIHHVAVTKIAEGCVRWGDFKSALAMLDTSLAYPGPLPQLTYAHMLKTRGLTHLHQCSLHQAERDFHDSLRPHRYQPAWPWYHCTGKTSA
jgi:LuxR family maltose regulon positive regulatory protein